jgi:hypothetical protein
MTYSQLFAALAEMLEGRFMLQVESSRSDWPGDEGKVATEWGCHTNGRWYSAASAADLLAAVRVGECDTSDTRPIEIAGALVNPEAVS